MQCNLCPLFSSWNNESDSGEACALFGDGWDSQFQYERNGTIVGCYIEKAYIKKVERRIEKHYEEEVEAFLQEQGGADCPEKCK